MNKRLMWVKKITISALTLTALQAQSAAALAMNQVTDSVLAPVVANVNTNVYGASSRLSFSDVQPGAWYYDNILSLVNRGIINGYGDGTFKPDNNITRAEFAKLVIVALSSEESLNNGKSWPENVIAAADEYDMNLYGSSVEDWNQKINRADMAQVAIDGLYGIRGKAIRAKDNMVNVLKDRSSPSG